MADQFEWPLFAKSPPTPEDFARQLCADLGLGGVYAPTIAHSIREQVCQARLNFDEASLPPDLKLRPFRTENVHEWEPEIRELDEEELMQLLKEQERNSR